MHWSQISLLILAPGILISYSSPNHIFSNCFKCPHNFSPLLPSRSLNSQLLTQQISLFRVFRDHLPLLSNIFPALSFFIVYFVSLVSRDTLNFSFLSFFESVFHMYWDNNKTTSQFRQPWEAAYKPCMAMTDKKRQNWTFPFQPIICRCKSSFSIHIGGLFVFALRFHGRVLNLDSAIFYYNDHYKRDC